MATETCFCAARRLGHALAGLLDALVTPLRRDALAFWIVLYLAGLIGWIAFFRAGVSGGAFYHAADWPKEYQYYSVIKESLLTWTIPWHTSVPLQPSQPTDRFLAIPETLSLLAPQAQLLRWMNIRNFVLVNLLLMYTVGMIGWHRLSRRYRFPPLVGLMGFVFFFNGYIVAHLAAGHTMWTSYYWLPWLLLLALQACEQPPSLRLAVLLALVLGGMVLQGGCHLYIWCLMFLGMFFMVRPRRHWDVGAAAVLSGLLAAYRFAPAAITFHGKVHRLTGFESAHELWASVVALHLQRGTTRFPWEFDYYIGLAGVWFIAIMLMAPLFMPSCRRSITRYWPLAVPAVVMLLLAFGKAPYVVLRYVWVPLLDTQRVPSRFAAIPVVVAITIACINASNVLAVLRGRMRIVAGCIGLSVVGNELYSLFHHATGWRMAAVEVNRSYQLIAREKPLATIASRPDPVYVACVCGSLALSVVALGVMVWWIGRTTRTLEVARGPGEMRSGCHERNAPHQDG